MFKKEFLHSKWSTGERIMYLGVSYRVGKMSYGDYFLEPGEPQGETKPFNKGTLWLKRVDKDNYKV